ncbi:prepilin peptidase [Patescibacteria group bacterium]|nr:prepilin peptidase [Patescibacteria group bacterium]
MSLLVVLILGLAIGSFLNVAIDRLPKNETILRGRFLKDYL